MRRATLAALVLLAVVLLAGSARAAGVVKWQRTSLDIGEGAGVVALSAGAKNAYAVVEGVFVGMVSKAYQEILGYDGIILQAVTATFGVFFLMAILYRARVIRATPKFTRGLIAVMGGLFAVMLINLVLALFGFNTGLRDNGPLGYVFSIVCIVVAALSFILSFNEIEEGVRMGLPQRYSWTAAFGILVSLVWLYLEILRLLSFLQGDE